MKLSWNTFLSRLSSFSIRFGACAIKQNLYFELSKKLLLTNINTSTNDLR